MTKPRTPNLELILTGTALVTKSGDLVMDTTRQEIQKLSSQWLVPGTVVTFSLDVTPSDQPVRGLCTYVQPDYRDVVHADWYHCDTVLTEDGQCPRQSDHDNSEKRHAEKLAKEEAA